jgi:hypothetical protein
MSIASEGGRKLALIVCDGKDGPSATQMISFAQPFADGAEAPYRIALEKNHTEVSDVESAFAGHQPDLLVLSRCTSVIGRDWIRLARAAGIPVLFHIDDDLLAVPASLGASKFKAYNSPERLDALRSNIEGSDLLYVSTPELANRFREHGIRTPIVAGDVYCAVAEDEVGALVGPATGPVIGYMGTAGHSADLAMIMPAVWEVLEAIPELHFEIFGTIKMPSGLERFGSRVRHIPPVPDYGAFLPFLRSLGWWVGLAPLEDNVFNRCKADTKWVEYSLAGIAVVASDLPVYRHACANGAGILAASGASWSRAIYDLICTPQQRLQTIQAAQAKLRQSYSVARLRQQIVHVFDCAANTALLA